jgi:hypothetical protein
MAKGQNVTRPDGSIVRCYAPGDGHLSFALDYEGKARPYDITDAEAEQACPYGWIVYRDGPYHRARPAR